MNPPKEAFKELIMEALREAAPQSLTGKDLRTLVRSEMPEHCDDSEPCYPGCTVHRALWMHLFSRSIYDLSSQVPRKIRAVTPGVYRLA